RNVHLHRRTAILHAGGSGSAPTASFRRDWHDQRDGSAIGPRGGNLLRDDCHDHRLRLLAPGTRDGYGISDHLHVESERVKCTEGAANRGPRSAWWKFLHVRAGFARWLGYG